jgi:hypothetical protein
MTELLQHAIAAIESLPDDVQDAIAARLLAEVEDERSWAERYQGTTDDQWDRMAENVRQSISHEPTTPLKDIFPLPPSS